MTRQQLLDLYFIETRAKLIDVAAFLDRIDRAGPEVAESADDFRIAAFRNALAALQSAKPNRAECVLMALSDPSIEPIDAAPGKGACGAYDPRS